MDRDWYSASVQYWDNQEATFDGVLGGYGHVSEPDIAESRRFLLKALAGPLREAAAGQRQLVAIGGPPSPGTQVKWCPSLAQTL